MSAESWPENQICLVCGERCNVAVHESLDCNCFEDCEPDSTRNPRHWLFTCQSCACEFTIATGSAEHGGTA